jgi:hypothetical protein
MRVSGRSRNATWAHAAPIHSPAIIVAQFAMQNSLRAFEDESKSRYLARTITLNIPSSWAA